MVYLETDQTGRVTLRHYQPSEIDTSGGTVVDSVPERPGDGYDLYVIDGQPTWKRPRYQYRDNLPELKSFLKEKVLERQVEEETRPVSLNGNEFPADRDSQGRIGSAIQQVERSGTPFPAMTTGGTQVELSLSELKSLADAYAQQVRSARARGQELLSTIENATDTSTLLSLDLESGW